MRLPLASAILTALATSSAIQGCAPCAISAWLVLDFISSQLTVTVDMFVTCSDYSHSLAHRNIFHTYQNGHRLLAHRKQQRNGLSNFAFATTTDLTAKVIDRRIETLI